MKKALTAIIAIVVIAFALWWGYQRIKPFVSSGGGGAPGAPQAPGMPGAPPEGGAPAAPPAPAAPSADTTVPAP